MPRKTLPPKALKASRPPAIDVVPVETLRRRIEEESTARPEWLFVVRESDTHRYSLFDGMRQQTLSPHRDKPEVAAVLAAGMTPWTAARNQTTFTVTMAAENVQPVTFEVPVLSLQDKPRTLLFRFGDALHLWCMGSAALLGTDASVGKFSSRLCDVVEEYWPHNLVVANVTRLIRSEALFHRFMSAIDVVEGDQRGAVRVDCVWSADQKLHMTSFLDRLGLNFLAHHAEADLRSILQRTIAGRLVSARRGEWVPGNTTVPWGYTLNQRTRTLACVDSLRPSIEQMLRIFGESTEGFMAVRQLADLGMPMARKRLPDGTRATLGDAGRPYGSMYRTLLRLIPVYVHGEYLMRHVNPGLSIDELAGYPVVRESESDRGEFQLLIKLPLPDGGWAPKEVLDAAAAALIRDTAEVRRRSALTFRALHEGIRAESADARLLEAMLPSGSLANLLVTRRGAAAHTQAPPFAGRRWTDKGREYQLFSPHPLVYELRSRPSLDVDVPPGGVA